MHPLAEIEEMEDTAPSFTAEEKRKIQKLQLPGDYHGGKNFGPRTYPRKPKENPAKWFAEHEAKLASLIRASK